jgi:DNA-binding GntR family transcriptional regulator
MPKHNSLQDGQARSLMETAYLHIRQKILSGELPAGAALSEASIAKDLGQSRTPLREAIRRLTAEGFLRQIPNRGSIVVEFSKRDVAELYELREALEVYAVGKTAKRTLQQSDIDALNHQVGEILVLRDQLSTSGTPLLDAKQMQRFIQTDLSFHATLVRAAANRRILKVFADTRVLLNVFALRRKGHDVAQLTSIHRYHHEILETVLRKDVQTVMRLMSEHIQLSKQERLTEYDEWEHERAMDPTQLGLADTGMLS